MKTDREVTRGRPHRHPLPHRTRGPGLRELPPYLVAGNRFGSYGFGAGLSGLLLALAPFGHAVAWILVLAAVVLGADLFVNRTF